MQVLVLRGKRVKTLPLVRERRRGLMLHKGFRTGPRLPGPRPGSVIPRQETL